MSQAGVAGGMTSKPRSGLQLWCVASLHLCPETLSCEVKALFGVEPSLMTNKCCHWASGEQRCNDSCLIQSLTSWQALLVKSQLITLQWQVWYHHWAGSCCMTQSRGTCWCSRKELLLHKIPLQASAVGEGRDKSGADLMQLLLSLRAGQEGSSTYLPEPSRAFCFLLLWIPASCPGSLPPLAGRWHCSGVSSLSVLFRITPKLAHCWKYALWVEKSSCSNAQGFQWNIRDFWRVSGS